MSRAAKPRAADVARWTADLSPPAASWGSRVTAKENRRKMALAIKNLARHGLLVGAVGQSAKLGRLASWGLDANGQPKVTS